MRKLLCVCLFIFAGPAVLSATTIADNFNSNSLNTALWSELIFGTGSISPANQQLELLATGDGSFVGVLLRTDLIGDIVGDFDVRTDFELLAPMPPVNGEPVVGLVLGEDLSEPFFVVRGVTSHPPYIDIYGGGVLNEIDFPTADMSGTLRFTRTGDLMSAYYLGGSGWVLVDQGVTHGNPIPYLALGIVSGEGGTVHTAFDNFSLQMGQPIPEPASIFLLGTGLGLLGLAARRRMQ